MFQPKCTPFSPARGAFADPLRVAVEMNAGALVVPAEGLAALLGVAVAPANFGTRLADAGEPCAAEVSSRRATGLAHGAAALGDAGLAAARVDDLAVFRVFASGGVWVEHAASPDGEAHPRARRRDGAPNLKRERDEAALALVANGVAAGGNCAARLGECRAP